MENTDEIDQTMALLEYEKLSNKEKELLVIGTINYKKLYETGQFPYWICPSIFIKDKIFLSFLTK